MGTVSALCAEVTHVPGSQQLVVITAPFPLRRPEVLGPETEGSGEDPAEGSLLQASWPRCIGRLSPTSRRRAHGADTH